MAKLISWNLMTLDGYVAGPGGNIDWHMDVWGPELEALSDAHGKEAGIAQAAGTLAVVGILVLDHPGDPVARRDHPAILQRVFRLETEHDRFGTVGSVQSLHQRAHGFGADEGHVAVQHEHVAFEAGKRGLGLLHGMSRPELRFLKDEAGAPG